MGYHPRTGKRRYANKTIRGSKRDAQAYLNAKLREQDLGTLIEASNSLLNDYLDRWLEDAARPKLRERTFKDYEAVLRRYVRSGIGGMKLKDIKALTIQSLYSELAECGLGKASIRKVHVILSSSLDQAVRWGMLAHNPAISVQPPRLNRGPRERHVRVFSPKEAKYFLDAAKGTRNGIVFSFALATGMRPGEYLALQWPDLDWDTGRIQVQRTLYRPSKGGGWRFEAPKTKRGYRSVTLPEDLVEELREHRDRQEPVGLDQPDLLFRGRNGEPLNSCNLLKRSLRPILRDAGLDVKLTLYSLRHSHATLLLAGGVNPRLVADRLGHGSVQITLDVYSHVIPAMQSELATKVNDLLYKKDEPED